MTDHAIFEQQVRAVMGYLSRRLNRVEDAHDLAQEVFLRLLEAGGKDERAIREPARYVFGIAAHVLADFRRRSRSDARQVTIDSSLAETSAVDRDNWLPDVAADRLNLQQQLMRGLAQLPPHQRAILIMHKRDGMSLKEIARKVGLSEFTVKIYLTRAKAHFRTLQWDR